MAAGAGASLRLELHSPDAGFAKLLDAHLEAGTHTLPFDGAGLARGLYLLRPATATNAASSRLVLVR